MAIRVGIVDDAPFIREILRRIVEKEKAFEVVFEAENGREAVEESQRHFPQILFMDIIMPEMTGIEATKKIMDEFPQTKIIAVSTNDHEGVVFQAMEAGCSDYIHKPFTKDQIIKSLNTALQQIMGGLE